MVIREVFLWRTKLSWKIFHCFVLCICVCVCVCVYIYIYTHTHTHRDFVAVGFIFLSRINLQGIEFVFKMVCVTSHY